MTLGALVGFIVYTIGFLTAQNLGWLTHPIAYWASTIVLVGLGLFACKELIWGLKITKQQMVYTCHLDQQ